MFDRIASFYDVMNSVMTAGLHHRWRARAADLAPRRPGRRACWTSPPAPATSRSSWPGASARAARSSASDFAEAMLDRAREKAAQGGRAHRFEWGNALELPYPDDRVRRGHGRLRRAQLRRPRPRGLAEMARVVRPGGRVVVLEITTPTRPPLSTFFRLWFDRVVPADRPADRGDATRTPTSRAP